MSSPLARILNPRFLFGRVGDLLRIVPEPILSLSTTPRNLCRPTKQRFCLASLGSLILSLSACSATLPEIPKETRIPVAVACLTRSQIPAQDFLPDSDLAELDDYQLVIALRQEQLKGHAWADQAMPLLEACAR